MGRIGKSRISRTDSTHIPKSVMKYFTLTVGDELCWHPPDEDFPATAELLAVRIVRFGEGAREKPR